MAADEVLLRAPAWLSLLAWTAGEWWRCSDTRDPLRHRARLAWTTGALALLVHTALAFHLRHFWSHDHAAAEIGRRTEEVVGFEFDGGIFVNYAFDVMWLAEVAWWWMAPASFVARPAALLWASRLVFVTLFVNGAIVFASGPIVPVGVVAVGLAILAWLRETRSPDAQRA